MYLWHSHWPFSRYFTSKASASRFFYMKWVWLQEVQSNRFCTLIFNKNFDLPFWCSDPGFLNMIPSAPCCNNTLNTLRMWSWPAHFALKDEGTSVNLTVQGRQNIWTDAPRSDVDKWVVPVNGLHERSITFFTCDSSQFRRTCFFFLKKNKKNTSRSTHRFRSREWRE